MQITRELIKRSAGFLPYVRGTMLFARAKVRSATAHRLGSDTTLEAVVDDDRTAVVKVTLLDSGRITSVCTCREGGICGHAVAVLLAYSEGHISSYETDNSISASAMLAEYSPISAAGSHDVFLAPVLSIDDAVPSLGFKVGSGSKSYMVKSIPQFVKLLENGLYADYSDTFGFMHRRESFDESSLFWCDFITSRMKAIRRLPYYNTDYGRNDPQIRELPLNGHDFDTVFERMLPSGFILSRSGKPRFMLSDSDPELSVNAVREGSGYRIDVSPLPDIISGAEHSYAVIDNRIYRLSGEYARDMLPLLTNAAKDETGLTLSRRGAKEFSLNALPRLEKHTRGNDLALLEPFIPEQLDVRYLIDMPEPGTLTASVAFYYYDKYVDPDASENDYPDIRRNPNLEHQAIDALTESFDAPEVPGGLYTIKDEERIYDFLKTGTEKLAKSGEVFVTDRLKDMNIARPVRPQVSLRVSSGLLDFDVDTGEFPREELADLMKSVREKRRYYRLRDGRFMSLENGEMRDFADTADGLGVSDEELAKGNLPVPLYRAMYLDSALKNDKSISSVDRDAAFKRLIRDFKTVEDSDFELPDSLEKVMRGYQKTGFRWLRTLDAYNFGGILADDMGLGKTLQVLSYLLSIKQEGKNEPRTSLIVCPASLVLNWGDEAKKWTPELSVALMTAGSAERKTALAHPENYDLMVMSYDLLRRDIEELEKKSFYACILDEAQYIKNQETQSSRAVKRIKAKVRFALTGTPIENKLSELWSIFDFLMPGYLGKYGRFRDRYEKPISVEYNKEARAKLMTLVHPFILRRMKTDVLTELPSKSEMNCYIEMGEEQRKYYLAYAQELKRRLEEGGQQDLMKLLAMLTRLRQLCCDPALCVENYKGGSAKLDECVNMVDELVSGGHRILIFSQFTSMLKRIEDRLEDAGIRTFTLKGETSMTERADLVKRFNAGEVPVFLISLKAGGTGLNLTGADTVFHFDPWWNVSAQNQATDRCYRIGQDKPVTVYKLIARDTIEENIIKLQDRKLELAKVVTDNADGTILDMSTEDIIELLGVKDNE